MTDTDPWERRFLDVLSRAAPEAPPAEAILYRRAAIARIHPGGAGAALLTAAAEVLAEEGLTRPRIMGCLRAALVEEPAQPCRDWFWNAGRSDLIPLADAHGMPPAPLSRTCVIARYTLPVVAALTVTAIACRL